MQMPEEVRRGAQDGLYGACISACRLKKLMEPVSGDERVADKVFDTIFRLAHTEVGLFAVMEGDAWVSLLLLVLQFSCECPKDRTKCLVERNM